MYAYSRTFFTHSNEDFSRFHSPRLWHSTQKRERNFSIFRHNILRLMKNKNEKNPILDATQVITQQQDREKTTKLTLMLGQIRIFFCSSSVFVCNNISTETIYDDALRAHSTSSFHLNFPYKNKFSSIFWRRTNQTNYNIFYHFHFTNFSFLSFLLCRALPDSYSEQNVFVFHSNQIKPKQK